VRKFTLIFQKTNRNALFLLPKSKSKMLRHSGGIYYICGSFLKWSFTMDTQKKIALNVGIITVFGVLAAVQYKKTLGGFITFKESFTSFFIAVLIGFLISTLFNIVLFNVIDLEAKTILSENVIKYTVEMMQKFGAKAADINKVVEDMRASDSFGVAGQLKGFFFNVIFYSIIGLVCSLIIKRVPPQSL
jgi:hypothetical protein